MCETTFKIEKWRRFSLLPLWIVTAINTGRMAYTHWPLSTGLAVFVCVAILLVFFLAVHSIWQLLVSRDFVRVSETGLSFYSIYTFKPTFVNWTQISSVNPPRKLTGEISFSYTGKDGAKKAGKIAAGLLGKENMASLLYLISEQVPQNERQ